STGVHTTDAADLTSGVLADARVQESNVTQHQTALTITESQISDLVHTVDTDTQLSEAEVDAFVANNNYSTGAHTTDAADLTTGVLADARVQESNVTQYETALTITESQISDLVHTVDTDTQLSEAEVDAFVANNNYSTGVHTTDAADLTSGVLADARVQESNVTQHETALTITESQISDLAHTVDTNTQLSEAEVDAFVANNNYSTGAHTTDAADLTSGVLDDARVQESNVTQHQTALTITESQISDLVHTVDTDTQLSEAEVDAFVANNNYSTGAHTTDAADLTLGVLTDARVQESNVTQHETALTITESQISDLVHTVDTDTKLSEAEVDAFVANNNYSTGAHTTDAADLTSGVLDDARVQESNITQHQTALTITESQISDLAHTEITAGAGIAITGDGSSAFPYSIINNFTEVDGSITNETNTGFSTVDVAGTDHLRISDSNGDLDIPLSDLSHTGTTGSIFFAGADNKPSENNSQLFWDNSNNRLGIGTASPTHKLQVNGQVRATSFANANGTAGSPAYRFNDDGNTGMYRADTDELGFSTAGTEAMRIDDSQNVGIGDFSSGTVDASLHVKSDTGVPLKIEPSTSTPTGTSGGQMFVSNDDGILYIYDGTRSKWLSVDRTMVGWGRNSNNTSNEYLRQFNGALSNQNGWRMVRNGTITAISAQSDIDQTWTFEVRKNDATTVIASITMTGVQGNHNNTLNVDINEGDFIQAYCNGTSVDYPETLIEIAWRK
ncbi:hypothetical protein, partial [Maribacter spongiicola]|uniref:hypothetical protein n=1 Tax=Maribacter spongiicola TaxID=1206753 RepID=UPI003F9D632A